MKSTGVVRKIDDLAESYFQSNSEELLISVRKDALEIYVEQDSVILKKYKSSCIFCSSNENLMDYKTKCVCAECMAELKK